MKQTITSLLLALLFTASGSALAQDNSAAKNFRKKAHGSQSDATRLHNLVSRPGTSQNFATDMAGGWLHVSNSTYAYDAQGRQTERIDRVPDTNANIYKYTAAFDTQGSQTQDFFYTWDGSQWVMSDNSYQILYFYSPASKPLEIIEQQWDGMTGSFQDKWRTVFTYNSGGYIASETYYDYVGTTWVAESRSTYTFGSTTMPPTGVVIEEFNGSAFEPVERVVNLTWHNYENFQPLTYTLEEWNGSGYDPLERYAITYDAFGGSVETSDYYDQGSWTLSNRWTETYDAHLNYTGSRNETWTGTWLTDYEDQEVLTYNANNDLTQRVFRNMFNINGTLEDDRKEVYDNFVYITAAPANLIELPVSLFPNPATDAIYLTGASGPAALTITDLTGRLVLKQQVDLSSGKVSVAALSSGTYMVTLANAEGSKTLKLVKE